VKAAITILALFGCMAPCVLAAQTAASCAACIGAADCNDKHNSCITECRAQYFSIDPKRTTCITQCETTSVKCAQVAGSDCRAQNLCR
jgi:hypothetical protein